MFMNSILQFIPSYQITDQSFIAVRFPSRNPSPNLRSRPNISRRFCFLPSMPSRPAGPITQDWEPVVLHKSKPKPSQLRDPKAVNAALRAGAQVQTVKKFDAGSNKKPAAVVSPRKLDEGTEPAALERVPAETRLAIQKARVAKKLSQAELAKLISERPQVVQDYEGGRAVPNQLVLAKMEKVLEVKLRGKIK